MATKTGTKGRVVFMEYSGEEIYSVITHEPFVDDDGTEYMVTAHYDVEWCKRDRKYYFLKTGACGPAPITVFGNIDGTTTYWAAKDVKVAVRGDAKVRRVVQARGRNEFQKALDGGGSDTFSEGECEYCPTCNDYLPTRYMEDPCEHVWWCEDRGDWSKPGDRCDWDCEECQADGRETMPESPKMPWMLVAEGYGIAASRIATIVRNILEKYRRTPESLADEVGWCYYGTNAIRRATMGEVHEYVTPKQILKISRVLQLTREDHEELYEAFVEAWY